MTMYIVAPVLILYEYKLNCSILCSAIIMVTTGTLTFYSQWNP